MKFVVGLYRDEDGMYIAECPAIPGCVSQGSTEAEAETNIADAIRECLAIKLTSLQYRVHGLLPNHVHRTD
jgi:predicted RNase H-like HicB family nuclease